MKDAETKNESVKSGAPEDGKEKVSAPPASEAPPVKQVKVTVAEGLKVPADMLAAVKEFAAGKPFKEVVIVAVGRTQVVFETDGTPNKLTVREL